MKRHCSQCGVAGHNKRQYDCKINQNNRKAELNLRNVYLNMNIDEKLAILNHAIVEIESDLGTVNENLILNQNTHDFYYQLYKDERKRHMLAQKSGPWELCVETFESMGCAEASYKIMKQNLISSKKIKDNLNAIWSRYVTLESRIMQHMERQNPLPNIKHTSQYFKELTFVLDITNSGASDCECPLCYDQIETKNTIQTNCKHSYCMDCMKNLSTSIKNKTMEPKCPLCRTTLKELNTRNSDILIELRTHFDSL
jgi:hypothetical protein